MGTGEAAARLRVSQRQVERMLRTGALRSLGTVGRTALVDPVSVAKLAQSRTRPGRPLSAAVAWAVLFAWSGRDAPWLTSGQGRNVRHLVGTTPAEELSSLTRSRATVLVLRGSASYLPDLRAHLTLSGASAPLRLGLTKDVEVIDGYIDGRRAQECIDAYGLVEDSRGNVTLRVTTLDDVLGAALPSAVPATDLSASLDPREREAGLSLLRELRRDAVDG